MKCPFLIIGGGLSGLAAGIRLARFTPNVVILERHSRTGGLNSYYTRNGLLLETGLHAFTNFASPEDKQAPLNLLFRQLKLSRKNFTVYPQRFSEIRYGAEYALRFSNDLRLLQDEVCREFPGSAENFCDLLEKIRVLDPFSPTPPQGSARDFLKANLNDPLLEDMLLCPLLLYGSAQENDMDLRQFLIMFRSVFQEGLFRFNGTIKDFLTILTKHFTGLGGKLRLSTGVQRILYRGNRVTGVELENGEQIEADVLLSTIGSAETMQLLSEPFSPLSEENRLAFIESVFIFENAAIPERKELPTILFHNGTERFAYETPEEPVDFRSGTICLPYHFKGRPAEKYTEMRCSHLTSYAFWKGLQGDRATYEQTKKAVAEHSFRFAQESTGIAFADPVFQDTHTPLTIERYTGKIGGAIYGAPQKNLSGSLGFDNLFLAGTDQGLVGIVGSMISGVTTVNTHLLPRI